jgi:hypothetical protein
MAVKTGISINTSVGGELSISGTAAIWCGSCSCTSTGTQSESYPIGSVGPGTYLLSLQPHNNCWIYYNGQQTVTAAVGGTSFNQQFGPSSTQWIAGSVTIRLVEGGTTDPNLKYDCVNGSCVLQTQYSTPGVFSSLTECNAICTSNGCQPPGANYCPPGKVCIESAEWSQIEQLTNQVQSKCCG